ncbi:MAG TPA: tyrosine--tRNA ligase [Ktedonobacterales bacterium]|jgi:tyrosyl-tRNA synthetase
MTILEEFAWRGQMLEASEGLEELLAREHVTLYNGFDPSAASLHVGSLVPIMALARMQRAGHSPIALVGGGTGMVGDPSGKTQERQLLSKEQVEENVAGIRAQLSQFLDFDTKTNPARVINNADWLLSIKMMDFLRDVGKHITVNYMLAKESVKRRLEQESGISFTEFSYMLLQAYDFVMLYDRFGCVLQTGGSDQWGNIVAGTELIRRMRGARGYGLVFPLLLTSTGVKFGKTEAGTVWLDPNLTSPYQFYQYWITTDDRDVITYLKYFTFLTRPEIEELAAQLQAAPEKREAQRRLAEEVTRLVHGEAALHQARQASRVLFGGEMTGLGAREVLDIFAHVPSSVIDRRQFEGDGLSLIDLVTTSGLASSKGEARRLIAAGGIYINNQRIADVQAMLGLSSLIEGQFLVARKGARDYHLIRVQ